MPTRDTGNIVLGEGQIHLNDMTFDVRDINVTLVDEILPPFEVDNNPIFTVDDFNQAIEAIGNATAGYAITAEEFYNMAHTPFRPTSTTDLDMSELIAVAITDDEDEELEIDTENVILDSFLKEFIKKE